MSKTIRRVAALLSSLLLASAVSSQTYPSKAVTLLVPYPAGGLSDVIARTVNNTLSKNMGQPVIVDNLGGASGSIAAQKVLNAPADGQIIFQGSPNELILAPLAISAVKFKSEDFRLVQMIATAQIAFLARKDLPVSNVDEFLEYARKQAAQGRPITYASVGPGSFYHLLGEHLSKITNIPMTHVPYKGMAPANQDLLGGQVDIFLAPFGKASEELQKQGKLKVLAMLNSERLDSVKDYPAITESKSLKNFTFNIWTGYFVKKDTPEPIVQVIHKAITDSLTDPAVRGGLEANSQLVAKPLSLQAVGKAYTDGTAQFRAIAKSINLQPQ
ncbi:ABC transporter substrate-binding protein [Limnohabitans sp. MMS-10A-160]|uniref:tripartite tricarboxylate transporter substrate binding protein n=1 Tax=unclassified Limnohabitans TaxID=2626134 RepID=UPI000D3B41B2|nr:MULTISPECIES: tripartite tricarboxylate transporter substrate binding protein [unclassified Limnohabitans]PUE15409.1 ABC transporter substrate-binding protein [Limnohabitans sp. MMS-10A-192]PUE23170.1 ABC transporter substrate-binding protein [Limnohabitans sp. MMS-10A-160]